MCGTRACGTCARSRVCARHDLRTCKKEMKRQKFMSITLLSSYVAPMRSYVTNVFVYNLYIAIFGRVYSYVLLCYSHVLVCYSYVLVCYSYALVWCFSHDLSNWTILPTTWESKEKRLSVILLPHWPLFGRVIQPFLSKEDLSSRPGYTAIGIIELCFHQL